MPWDTFGMLSYKALAMKIGSCLGCQFCGLMEGPLFEDCVIQKEQVEKYWGRRS